MTAMFDSVTVDEIPKDAKAVAGYVDGVFQTYPELERKFPHARKISIAVAADGRADVLDIESGDATIEEAAAWVRAQWEHGERRPRLYASVGNWKALAATLSRAGIKHRPWGHSYRRWSAHYTDTPHRCGRSHGMPGLLKAGATQWTKRSMGRNLDESLCGRTFLR